MNSKPASASGASVASRLGHLARYLLTTLFVTFLMAEATARLITETAPNGLRRTRFREVALLPLRPDAALVRQAIDKRDRFPDHDLGWNVWPNQRELRDYTNALGFRIRPGQAYSTQPPPGKVRIQTLGDSFVYCSEVKADETWQTYLERQRDDVEVMNLGLPAAGTDQAFLRWRRDGKAFKSHIVLLGIWPDNIFRNLNIVEYYRTQSTLAYTKPRLARDDAGGWRFVNAPTMSRDELVATLANPEGRPLLKYEFWYEPRDTRPSLYQRSRLLQLAASVWRRYQRKLIYNKIYTGEIPDGIDVTLAIVKLFAREVRDAGSIPIVLVIPDRKRLDLQAGTTPFPLVERMRAEGIDVIDTGPTFGREIMQNGAARYYVGGVGHQSPFGNEVFAQYLAKELRPWIEKAHALSEEAQVEKRVELGPDRSR